MSSLTEYLPLLHLIATASAAVGLLLSVIEIRRSRLAMQSVVMQSVVSAGNDLIAIAIQYPKLAQQTSLNPSGLKDCEELQAALLGRAFLCYCENVLAQKRNFPPGQSGPFRAMIEEAFRKSPSLHQIVAKDKRLWTDKLKEIAAANLPETGKADEVERSAPLSGS
jgi:hypothetical protein